jgi:cell division protease FtsH
MSDDKGRNRKTEERRGRRIRTNLPLVILLCALAAIVFMHFNPQGNRLAPLTYAEYCSLGANGALEEIEILHAPDRVEIRGKLDRDSVQSLKNAGKLTEEQYKRMENRDAYVVEDVMRNVVDDPREFKMMSEWVKTSDKIAMRGAAELLPHFLLTIAPWFLIIAFFWFFILRPMRQAGGAGGVLSFGRSRARMYTPEMTTVTFADVAGIEEAKEEVKEIVEFLRNPQRFQRLGGRIPRGVMLVGPPGCGKTLLAKAIAGEAGVPFFAISGSDFVEMFVGVGASRVRDLFSQAKEKSPCLIFLDEIDAVGRRRGSGLGGGHDEREQTLNQILVEMDGFETDKGIIVIAATNRPDVLDPALLRPGRFDRQIVLDMPDVKGREEILRVHARKVKLSAAVNLALIARGTPGFSGAELEAVINEAAIAAAMNNRESVAQADLEEARDKVRWGRSRRSRVITDEEKRALAYHEAGHALMHLLLPEAEPLHKVTIIPRGMALGATFQLPERDRYIYGRKRLLAQITILYSGRIAEKMATGDLSTGASDDIRRATDMARSMVTQFGMSDQLGPLNFSHDEETLFLGREITRTHNHSDKTVNSIDAEISAISQACYRQAEELLSTNRDKLERLAEALVRYESLSADEARLAVEGGDIESHRRAQEEQQAPPRPNGAASDAKRDRQLPSLDRGPSPGFAGT